MNSYQLILGIIVVLTLINFATLAWVNLLQKRLRQRDQSVAATQKDVNTLKQEANNVMLAEALIQMEQTAGTNVSAALDEAVTTFSQSLTGVASNINQQMEAGAVQLIQKELQNYKQTLDNLRQNATSSLGQINDAIDKQKQNLTADLEKEIAALKIQLMAKFEAKLADVVSAYLAESLGNEVDLGAQSQYLFKMLDEHKAELKKDILGEV